MAYYGNILTLLDTNDDLISIITDYLETNKVKNQRLDHTLYVETSSKENTRQILTYLDGLGIRYLWFHNAISDGSRIFTGNVDPADFAKIKNIMLE